MANKYITAMSDWKKMLNTGKSYGKIRAEQIKRDFGGNPSDQSWNPTREEVKEWNKEANKWNKDRIPGSKKNQRWLNATRVKQVLPIVGRTIGVASGWGTLIAGVSLLAQTKKAKKFRQDPIHRRATIKKLFKVRN